MIKCFDISKIHFLDDKFWGETLLVEQIDSFNELIRFDFKCNSFSCYLMFCCCCCYEFRGSFLPLFTLLTVHSVFSQHQFDGNKNNEWKKKASNWSPSKTQYKYSCLCLHHQLTASSQDHQVLIKMKQRQNITSQSTNIQAFNFKYN